LLVKLEVNFLLNTNPTKGETLLIFEWDKGHFVLGNLGPEVQRVKEPLLSSGILYSFRLYFTVCGARCKLDFCIVEK